MVGEALIMTFFGCANLSRAFRGGCFGMSIPRFWDVDPETIDDRAHCRYVIQRVLERGSLEDIRAEVLPMWKGWGRGCPLSSCPKFHAIKN